MTVMVSNMEKKTTHKNLTEAKASKKDEFIHNYRILKKS